MRRIGYPLPMSQTLLTLAPEFGGQRFGPFQGVITLGSDPSRCQVVLHPSTGVQPVHALLTDMGSTWQLQPAAVGCAVFLRKPNGRVGAVTTGVSLSPGDSVVLGGPTGPALMVNRMAGAAPGARPGGAPGVAGRIPGSQHLNSNAFAREARRQVESSLVTTPIGREVYRYWTRFRSGAMLRPRYIIGAVIGIVVVMGGGCLTCLSSVAVWLGFR